MDFKIIGNEGDYLIKNENNIIQYTIDENGTKTGDCIIHIITDSIENSEDRNKITKTLEEFIIN